MTRSVTYAQALDLYQAAGDRGNEAATLNNIGNVLNGLGDRQGALDHYHQALPIARDIGNRAGEATTLNNIGGVLNASWGSAGGARPLPPSPPHPP